MPIFAGEIQYYYKQLKIIRKMENYNVNPELIEEQEKRLNTKNEFKRKFEFDRRGLYASDLDSKVKYQAATIAAGIYTVNDWRKVENRPPIEGGDKVLVSANLRDIANETAVNNAPEPEPKKTKKDDKNKDGDQDDE